MQSSDHDIDTLNGLIKSTIDSVDGYRAAAEDADNARYQALFFKRADERETVADRLQSYVRELGGTPEDGGSLAAGAHRAFMGLRDAITGSDDTAIIEEVERGEDRIKENFEAAMTDDEISPETRSLITDCYQSVREGHDEMRDLKHGLDDMRAGVSGTQY
jgi:uncharacterized protein (TIGR02284 family)